MSEPLRSRALLARLADLDEKLAAAKAKAKRRTDWRLFEPSDALAIAVN